MMYKKLKIAFIFLMICMMHINSVQAQDKKLVKANETFKRFAFIDAADLYKELIKKGNNSAEVYTKLGDCYYYNGNYSEAAEWYGKIINSSNNSIDPEYYFRYAQALNNSQKYKESEAVMQTYYSKVGKKDASKNWNETKLMAAIQKQSGRYNSIKGVVVNSPFSDFGTSFYDKEKVIFTSAKDTGVIIKRKHSWNEKSFLKLYTADITADGGLENPVLLKGEVNTRYHQSTPAITKDGKTMFFTRNNYFDGKIGADKKGTTYLKLYTAQNIKGEWKNVKELPFPINSDGFSSAHPALSPDESELYFVSDRDNKFGNSDLYVVSLKKGASIIGNDVTKLSDEINTLGRETYPFMDAAGVLYFASDGHPGLGGLDIFAAIKDQNGVYHVVNMGNEINTSADDFAYAIQTNKKGYFSSNRSGNDDIYSFSEVKPVDFDFNINPVVSGLLRDYNSKAPIEGVAVEIYNAADEKISTLFSDKDGKYVTNLDPFLDYKMIYRKSGLDEKTQLVAPLKPLEKREYLHEFTNELVVLVGDKQVTIKTGDNLTDKLELKPIYFNYNGYKIRESSKAELNKVVELMIARPSVSVKVNSHTDSRGRDDFNMKLSENRAQATVDYLVKHGVSPERVSGEGFGETRLINHCTNGEKCTEAEHELNRRSEFIILLK